MLIARLLANCDLPWQVWFIAKPSNSFPFGRNEWPNSLLQAQCLREKHFRGSRSSSQWNRLYIWICTCSFPFRLMKLCRLVHFTQCRCSVNRWKCWQSQFGSFIDEDSSAKALYHHLLSSYCISFSSAFFPVLHGKNALVWTIPAGLCTSISPLWPGYVSSLLEIYIFRFVT